MITGAIPHHRELVSNLHECRPDVVEELNLDDRLQPSERHPDRAADDIGLGQRRVEDAIAAESPLEPMRRLEHATFAGNQRQRRLVTGIGDVLSEDDDARVMRHLVLQRGIDSRDHRVGLALRFGSDENRLDVGSTSGE